jgi:carbamate kinase
MIGYMIEQELGNLLPFEVPFATLLTMVEVDGADPAFENPAKFVGPDFEKPEADRLAAAKGWVFKQDGARWRRVVPSPLPKRIFENRPIKWLLEHGTIVICAGGGGIPTMYERGAERRLAGVEAVIDKDLCSELLAREVEADRFVMLTDADAVYVDWGTPAQRPIRRAPAAALAALPLPAGSMGPKVEAACRFVTATGKTAAIGALPDLASILAGEAGTTVDAKAAAIEYGT